ncbi:MAG: hypothetical protein V1822_00830 [Candidatus Micrarchaeota archaeon]
MDIINGGNYRTGMGVVLGFIFSLLICLPVILLTQNRLFIFVFLACSAFIGGFLESYFSKKFSQKGMRPEDEMRFHIQIIVAIGICVLISILFFILDHLSIVK